MYDFANKRGKELYQTNRVAALIVLVLSYFLLSSCGSPPSKLPEGNIDVDSEIYIVPIGDVDEKYLYPLIPKLEKRFTTKVRLAMEKRMPIPDYAYDYEAKQYAAIYILSELIKMDVPEGVKILGVADVDLFLPKSDLPFIFGQAQYGKSSKGALISILRMDPASYVDGKPNDKLLTQRMIKEAIHELGHVFGLRNCNELECVMYLPRNLKELDNKTENFCLKCQKYYRALRQSEVSTPQSDNN